MRVSKTVKEYITKEVHIRVEKKYAARLAEERDMCAAKDEANDAIISAALEAIKAARAKMLDTHPFLRPNYDDDMIDRKLRYNVGCIVEVILNPGEKSTYRAIEDDTKAAVEDIIVTLELGGTKADLERMLAEIETAK